MENNLRTFVSVKKLDAFYDKKQILQNLSFELKEGELVCLCGPNGCGKSTLLSVLADVHHGSLSFSKNSVFFNYANGKILSDTMDAIPIEKLTRRDISLFTSFLVQNESCVWNLTCEEFVRMGRFVHGDVESKIAEVLTEKYMTELGISFLAKRSVITLSGGEFQKCRIARSLVQQSPVLLLDEPIANLDFDAQFSFMQKIRDLCRKDGISAVVSIHDLNLASIFADKILLLGGRKDSCSQSIFGSVSDIFKVEILQQVYGTNLGLFVHPEYKAPQVFVKIK